MLLGSGTTVRQTSPTNPGISRGLGDGERDWIHANEGRTQVIEEAVKSWVYQAFQQKEPNFRSWWKYFPFIMYYESALLLFIRKLHCLQTFEHMSALLAIKA